MTRHGCYVVKNPDQEQLNSGISREEAARAEQSFFSSTAPWNSPDLEHYRLRLGTCSLRNKLSSSLAEITRRCVRGCGCLAGCCLSGCCLAAASG